MSPLLFVYFIALGLFLFAGVIFLLLSLDEQDEGFYAQAAESRRTGARLVLVSPIWPVAVVWWLVVTAFPQNEEK